MSKLRSFLDLDSADRVASIEAMGALAIAAVLVRFVAPRRWRKLFGPVSPELADRSVETPAQLGTIRRVRLAVARAQRNVPSAPNCLPQALAARWMLRRRDIASQLFIGTDHASHESPRFHAWLKVGPEWVTGHCDESHYSLLVPQRTEAV